MNIRFFWVPACHSEPAEEELNRFLTTHRTVQLEKAFASSGTTPGWSICVEWLPVEHGSPMPATAKPKTSKIDYRELLDDDTFHIFAVLRSWRKERAAEQGVPVYTVATNEQLARIARDRIQSKVDLERVDGFGSSRMGKYSDELLSLCQQTMTLKSEIPA